MGLGKIKDDFISKKLLNSKKKKGLLKIKLEQTPMHTHTKRQKFSDKNYKDILPCLATHHSNTQRFLWIEIPALRAIQLT